MHRLLERLDAAASTVVPLLYLVGLALGVVSYFTGLTVGLGLSVGLGLACATELHSFLQQRRTRSSWALYARTRRGGESEAADATRRAFAVDAAILAALLTFSAYNAIAFAAATWRPSPGFLPPAVQIAIRGLIVPVFFFLSGFLAPLVADAGAMLARASHDMLDRTLRVAVRQWKRRIDVAAKSGLDLAPIAAALMEDAGDLDGARRVRMIADGLAAVEGRTAFSYLPTGPGTPGAMPVITAASAAPFSPAVAAMGTDPRPTPGPAVASDGGVITPARRRRRRGRHADILKLTPPTPEMRVRDVLAEHPSATVGQIAKWARVGKSAASKWRAVILAEQAERRDEDEGDAAEAAV